MLGDFEDQPVVNAFDFQSIQDGGDFSFELHIHDGADNLGSTEIYLRDLSLLEQVGSLGSNALGLGKPVEGGHGKAFAQQGLRNQSIVQIESSRKQIIGNLV